MNINSTVISGFQALNDISYLLKGKASALLVTDKNIETIPAVQALIAQLKQHIASARTEGTCAGDMSCRRGTDGLVFLYDGIAVPPARVLRIRVLRADWNNQLT